VVDLHVLVALGLFIWDGDNPDIDMWKEYGLRVYWIYPPRAGDTPFGFKDDYYEVIFPHIRYFWEMYGIRFNFIHGADIMMEEYDNKKAAEVFRQYPERGIAFADYAAPVKIDSLLLPQAYTEIGRIAVVFLMVKRWGRVRRIKPRYLASFFVHEVGHTLGLKDRECSDVHCIMSARYGYGLCDACVERLKELHGLS